MSVTKIPNHGSSPTYLLREDGKVKSHTVDNITSLGVEKIARISQILKGVELVPAQSAIKITRSRTVMLTQSSRRFANSVLTRLFPANHPANVTLFSR